MRLGMRGRMLGGAVGQPKAWAGLGIEKNSHANSTD